MRPLLLVVGLVCPMLAIEPLVKLSADEKTLLDLANKARSEEKVPALTVSSALTEIARRHAENMAKQEKMDHVLDGKNPAQRARDAKYVYRHIGENIGKAEGDADIPAPPPADMHEAWMKSKSHRDNLLNGKFREVGLAIVRSKKGNFYYAQVFGTPRSPSR